ncbi:hypothetical protein BC937DRAFT_92340 [Endogone sp. FLAS-F59071]|nr:hypothetical protein BC937DRAFT_92340 [Endogone sp. FLAS-F59071]|eukprot:RUS15531.1 hypothetical protein BC937DRAFT_92340 [Endogone sp. FLAS-F59071]
MADDENTKPPVSEELFQLLTEDGGLKKRIIKESQGPLPPNGANLKVHYVGTLYPDDITFDSSRDRNVPFTFLLGEGQVIKGWDEGVKTMRVGEVAELICSPEYGRIGGFFVSFLLIAYGKRGQPPQIPENATLKFEVELLDFTDGKTVRTPAQKISDATKKKEEGNDQFKKGSFKLALFSYQKVHISVLDSIVS